MRRRRTPDEAQREIIGAAESLLRERPFRELTVDEARDAVEGIVAVYAEHGPVLRALADAAVDDPDVERAYGSLVQSFVDVTTRHIEAEIAAGRVLPVDAEQTAKALVWMMERYLTLSLGREPSAPPEVITGTLATIVGRVLYGVG